MTKMVLCSRTQCEFLKARADDSKLGARRKCLTSISTSNKSILYSIFNLSFRNFMPDHICQLSIRDFALSRSSFKALKDSFCSLKPELSADKEFVTPRESYFAM